ncbi:MAG: TonB-dependent receptor [Bacteroidetes bacterium]|nr:TonB-dependent receptor [Bacteroidota bacterium]
MYKQSILLFAFFFFQVSIFAQSITGALRTGAGEVAEFATVKLLRAADSSYVKGMATGADGRFLFLNVSAGQYLIKAELLGYTNLYSEPIAVQADTHIEVPPMTFSANNLLQEATISAKLPTIERQLDKVVVNVEGSTLAAGNNALELLQRSPGVVLTPQGAVILEGKAGVRVLIDGKPAQLEGDQLVAFLQSLPGESISKIELITRPSSKYDAEGVSGIINIRLKKNQSLGVNGVATAGITQSIHARLRTGLNLNYRPGKLNFFGNANVVDGAQSVGQEITRQAAGKVFEQTNPLIEQFGAKSFKAGADFFANEHHTLGVLVLGNYYNNNSRKDNTTRIFQEGKSLIDSTLYSSSLTPNNNNRVNYNVNYHYTDTLGNELSLDADRITFHSKGSNSLANQHFNAENVLLSRDALFSDLGSDITIWSVKTDYVKTRKNGLKIEAGAKLNWTNSDNSIQSTRTSHGQSQADPGRSNRFNYEENIAAAYTNVGKQGQKFNWQLGLRAERTRVKGKSTDLYGAELNKPDTAYLGLFPTAYLQYNLKPNHQLGFSYNRRLSRPAYQDMNPFVWQIDPYTSERGNPYLRPAYTHAAEISYTYRYAASISLGYSRTTNLVNTVARQEGIQAYTQPQNLNQQDNIGLNVNLPLPIKSWWEGYVWMGVWHNQYRSQLANTRLNAGAFGGGCYVSQQITLKQGYGLEASFWAQFPTRDGVFVNKGIASASIGAKKSLWKDKATLKISVNDLFHTQRWAQSVDFGSVRGSMRNTWESQNVAVSFSWKFGNQQLKTRNRNTGGADDSEGRIKARKE